MVRVSLSLKESDFQIASQMNKIIAKRLKDALRSAAPLILNDIKSIVRSAISSSPEYRELFGGSLQAELGLASPAVVDRILDMWIESISIEISQVKSSPRAISGGLSIFGIRDGYADVLSSSEATYTTEKGRQIPWLQWLLLEGDRVIITDYAFSTDIGSGQRSRTGLGVMRKDTRKRWRVPPQFSGTSDNNFVSRSLEQVSIEIEKTIRHHIERAFGGA
jgi:hypothetical protein